LRGGPQTPYPFDLYSIRSPGGGRVCGTPSPLTRLDLRRYTTRPDLASPAFFWQPAIPAHRLHVRTFPDCTFPEFFFSSSHRISLHCISWNPSRLEPTPEFLRLVAETLACRLASFYGLTDHDRRRDESHVSRQCYNRSSCIDPCATHAREGDWRPL
jgi:hypothetical protein